MAISKDLSIFLQVWMGCKQMSFSMCSIDLIEQEDRETDAVILLKVFII